mmetsp:Transcript_2753/g.8344  ORF Transcript_2753/g.8344 Transcript_2753/m.8344 type:complete len:432 (+) Transcript_2753:2342-3637(+)
MVLQLQGKYKEAEDLFQRSIAINTRAFGSDSMQVALDLSKLAELLRVHRRYDDMKRLYERAISALESSVGEENPDFASALVSLAGIYHVQGQYDEAEPIYERAHRIEVALGSEHPDAALRLRNFAEFLKIRGQNDRAKELFRRSIEIQKAALGEGHRDVAPTLCSLASLLAEEGKLHEAQSLFVESLEITEKTRSELSAEALYGMLNLVKSLMEAGEHHRPLDLATRTARVLEKMPSSSFEDERMLLGKEASKKMIEVILQQQAPRGYDRLQPGTPIVVQHLKSRPDLNGRSGRVKSYVTSNKRYAVKVDEPCGETISLKPSSILQTAQGAFVVSDSGEFLHTAEISGFRVEGAVRLFTVRVSGEVAPLSVPEDRLRLPPGTLVRIMNGPLVTIESWESADDMYNIVLSSAHDNYKFKLKPSQVVVAFADC